MSRTLVLACFAAALLLSACSQVAPAPAPTAAPTAAPASLIAPTADAFGFGSPAAEAPSSLPTTEPTAEPVQTFTVQRGTVEDIITLSGQIAPAQAALSFAQDGIVAELYVQPGQSIAKGDLVAELDMGELRTQLRQAQIAAEQEQRALDQASQAGQLAVQQAQLDVEAAKNALAKLKAPATAVAIAQAQTDIRLAQTNLDRVRNDASRVKNSAKENLEAAVRELQAIQSEYGQTYNELQRRLGTQDEKELRERVAALAAAIREAEAAIDQAQIDYDTARNNEVAAVQEAEAQLDLARARLEDLQRGPDQYAIADLEREVRRAELAVAQAKQNAAPDPIQVKAAQISRLQIEEIQTQISAHRLYASMAGEVALVNTRLGDVVSAGSPVVTLLDHSRQELLAQGDDLLTDSQSNPVRLTIGQPVIISFDRYPGRTFNGALTRVPAAPDAEGNIETTYQTSFDAQGQSFALGDAATISITLARKADTLWLPREAVQLGRDRSTVIVNVNGDRRRAEILTGIITADRVEILSGLNENDVVILP